MLFRSTGLPFIGPGTYSVSELSLGFGSAQIENLANYTFTFDVSGVETGAPEPATFGLAAAALAGLFAVRQRRRG